MSAPLTPPPSDEAGALTQPRQLQRWLDINPVSKLTRTQAYITLPLFSVESEWLGYSNIVAAFNYEGPNNFSLIGISELPISPNYFLCIMWRTEDGTVYRYKFWENVGEVIYFNIPFYTGQKIAENFRFEIWSTDSSPSAQTTALSFYTSVLGNVDYRYGSDFTLVNNDGEVTDFSIGYDYNPIAAPSTNLYAQFTGNSGISGQFWTAIAGANFEQVQAYAPINSEVDPLVNGNTVITNGDELRVTAPSNPATSVVGSFLVFRLKSFDAQFSYLGFCLTSSTTPAIITAQQNFTDQTITTVFGDVNSVDIATGLELNKWYMLYMFYDYSAQSVGGYILEITQEMTEVVLNEVSVTIATPVQAISVGYNSGGGAGTANIDVAELLIYDTNAQLSAFPSTFRDGVVDYVKSKYALAEYTFPFTWPIGSYPSTN